VMCGIKRPGKSRGLMTISPCGPVELCYYEYMGPEKRSYTTAGLERAGFADSKAALAALDAIMESTPGDDAGHILDLVLCSPAPDEALANLSTLIKAQGAIRFSELAAIPRALEMLTFLLGASPFLSSLLCSRPKLFKWLFLEKGLHRTKDRDRFDCEIKEALKKGGNETKKTLRLYRQAEFLRLGARDLLGLAQMEETTRELSALASAMLDAAIEAAQRELEGRFGAPCHDGEGGRGYKGSGFAVIGLGKLGAGELNYSSDIDIMYVCESMDGMTCGAPGKRGSAISLGEFYTKLAVRVTALLSEVTAEGLVFRVDLALRPGGRSGALTQSLAGAELYYEAQGREWERAAMIKASPVAGDEATGRAFIEMIQPFVFRRHLDFRAIEEIKGMKEKINLSIQGQGTGLGDRGAGEGFNVKLGRGGIREIEFFAQAMQLIHGGRNAELRQRGTLAALKALVNKGLVKARDGEVLEKAYIYLRNLEHRLQIIECRQTHTLSGGKKGLKRVARMMGCTGAAPFLRELTEITGSVHRVFRGLFYGSTSAGDVDKKVLLLFSTETGEDERRGLLHEMGFRDTATALQNLELLRKGPGGLRRTSARARAVFERTAPYLLSKILKAPDPDLALKHLERFISSAGARSTQYALLVENPPVAEKLINIFGTSDFLSRGITERPEDLDLLLSRELSTPLKTKEEFLDEFTAQVLTCDKGLEERLDAMRRIRNAEVLRIGLNHLSGTITPQEVSAQMTRLAEAALHAAWQVALQELGRVYALPAGAGFAVIGLGKLGAGELGFGSDLDIIFVYKPGEPGAVKSEGSLRNISALDFFVRLCQRIISALTVKTKEGSVFSVDTRLRPSGSSGPLVVSRESLVKYHGKSTALWERQAFIRARHVAGDRSLGNGAVGDVKEIIFSKALSKADVTKMMAIRKRMEDEIGRETDARYNFKTGRGGVVDIEFLVQALQLKWGGQDRAVRAPGTMEALHALSRGGFIIDEDYAFLREAYAFMRRIEMGERIMHDRPETFLLKDAAAIAPLARGLGYAPLADPGARLLADYARISAGIRKIYKKTLKSLLR